MPSGVRHDLWELGLVLGDNLRMLIEDDEASRSGYRLADYKFLCLYHGHVGQRKALKGLTSFRNPNCQ